MAPVFLIGGGRDEGAIRASHTPFVAATDGGPIAALILDEGADTDRDRWTAALAIAGAREVRPLVVSAARPPRVSDVAGAAGVFVAGGWTPGYQEALVAAGTDWLPAGVPYAGFSAGAAIAGSTAVVGGWRLGDVAICAEEAGEDLEALETRPGLGLVPFAVDVHATQWGTLTRLVHAAGAGRVDEGWAIDEGTVVIVENGDVRVAGEGSAYRIRREGAGVRVTIGQAVQGIADAG